MVRPQGPRDHVLRLQRHLRRLRRGVEHVAEGQEKSRELLRNVLEEVMGHNNFTISELGYQPDHFFGKGDLRLV